MAKLNVPFPNATLASKTILLVEDNTNDAELTIRALRKSNILNEVVVARDGEEALEYLFGQGRYSQRNTECLPAVVLLDLKLPKVDGLEVLHHLRSEPRTHEVPVVILTSSKEDRDLAECYKQGANSFICKPVDFDEFAQAIGQLGLYWLVLNEPPPLYHS